MTNKSFLQETCKRLGAKATGNNYELERAIIEKVQNSKEPLLIIFDEVEYLKVTALNSLKTIMQELKDKAGFVVSGIIKEWLMKMAKRNKPGMPQLLRRLGHSWVKMEEVHKSDVISICKQKQITDKNVVQWLYNNTGEYDSLMTYVGDLSKVAEEQNVEVTVELCVDLFND